MSNLLPQEMKSRMRTEYRLRALSVGAFVLAGACTAWALLLIPPFVLVSSKRAATETELVARDTTTSDAYAAAARDIERANMLATQLNTPDAGVGVTRVITELRNEAGKGITINGVVLNRTEQGGYTVDVRGVATTRDELARFIERLEKHPLVTTAEVPFSNLAQARDAAFTASITIRPNPAP